MKKLVLPFMIVAITIGIYEQSKAQPNIYILCATIAIFMFGMMQLGAKIPSKHEETEVITDETQETDDDKERG